MVPPDADRILAEASWVRALARSLLQGEEEALDLAQEALSEALAADVPASRPGLRAWLRTVLRRKAGRRYDARSADVHALQGLARERATGETRTEQVLELHGELVQALGALASGDRDLLVRRYLEEESPRSLARELGIPPATLRKRLARARQRLRGVLEASERGVDGWRRGLLVLALPGGSFPPGAGDAAPTVPAPIPAVIAPGATLFVMAKSKYLLLSLVSIGLLAGIWVSARSPWSAEGEDPGAAAADALALAPNPGAQDLASAGDAERLAITSGVGEAEESVGETQGRAILRVLGEGGMPLPAARVFLALHGGELLEDASAKDGSLQLPVDPRLRVFLEHPDYCTVLADLGAVDQGSAHTVCLEPRPALRLRLTVDGAEPGEEIVLSYLGKGPTHGLSELDAGLSRRLERAGFAAGFERIVCGPRGEVTARIPHAMDRLSLKVPGGYLVRSVNGERWSNPDRSPVLAPGDREHAIDLMGVPALTGRLVWEDDGAAVDGSVEYVRVDGRGFSIDGVRWSACGSDGRFRIGVDEQLHSLESAGEESDRLQEPGAWLGARAHAIRLEASHPDAAKYMRHEFVVTGASFPLEVGDIAVKRLPVLDLRVLGRTESGWRPLVAGVRSAMDGVTTGRDGRASLRVWDSDHLDVLAAGHEFVRVPVTAAAHPDGMEIRLEAAPDLRVRMPAKLASKAPEDRPRVQIRFSKSPFGSWRSGAGDQPEFNNSIYTLTQGVWRSGPSAVQSDSVEYYVPDSGVVTISGLARGVDFELVLVDVYGGEFCSRSVVFDGPLELADWPGALDPAWLSVEVLDGSGEPGGSGRFGLKGQQGWRAYQPFEAGRLRAGPLAPRPLVLSILPGDGADTVKRELLLSPGENNIQVDMGEADFR